VFRKMSQIKTDYDLSTKITLDKRTSIKQRPRNVEHLSWTVEKIFPTQNINGTLVSAKLG
jgi:hypothetical protein